MTKPLTDAAQRQTVEELQARIAELERELASAGSNHDAMVSELQAKIWRLEDDNAALRTVQAVTAMYAYNCRLWEKGTLRYEGKHVTRITTRLNGTSLSEANWTVSLHNQDIVLFEHLDTMHTALLYWKANNHEEK